MLDDAPTGARIADTVTGFMGSWRFLILQTVLVAIWLAGNIYLLSRPFDPYPFILLNLAFSTQAAYAAPLILLAGNRSAQRDRLTLEHAASEADLEEKQNDRLLRGNTEILEHVAALENQILQLEKRIIAALKPDA
jgi:Predicted membrane protein